MNKPSFYVLSDSFDLEELSVFSIHDFPFPTFQFLFETEPNENRITVNSKWNIPLCTIAKQREGNR